MRDVLENEGFMEFKGCNCQGGRYQFKHVGRPGIIISIALRYQTFEIKQGFKVVSRGQHGDLESELIKLFE